MKSHYLPLPQTYDETKGFPECTPPDAHGECDHCHYGGGTGADKPRPLWNDYSEPGDWQYCKTCWHRLIERFGAAAFSD